MARSRIKCSACKKRIPDYEPDLILCDLENEAPSRYFHTRCGEAAYAAVTENPSARAHPDAGGDHELFVWVTTVKDAVCKGIEAPRVEYEPRPYESPRRPTTPPADAAERVLFSPFEDFDALTQKILLVAEEIAGPYGRLLRLIGDCHAVLDGPLYRHQYRGASYKQLAAIAHVAGMKKPERIRWYRLAESLPLPQRHAGHILSKLKGGA
ncbi:MAG: hypothetical protein M3Q49_02795 [Actinomycetota bacterium]|nr:hypothetical protein [Actinomycetota bacterium]